MDCINDNITATVTDIGPMIPVDSGNGYSVTRGFRHNKIKQQFLKWPASQSSQLQEVFWSDKHVSLALRPERCKR
jgi:hypothetical protein